MKGLFWNIRGLGKKSRVGQLKELITKEQLDIVGIKETIEQEFTEKDLVYLNPGGGFVWDWIPAKGHFGGILLGIKDDVLEVESWEKGEFFLGAIIRNELTNFRWSICSLWACPACTFPFFHS